MTKVCAIFDIGKTNKKFFLFDEAYNIVFESSENFQETEDEDGFACDDLSALTQWVKNCLFEKLGDKDYTITGVNFSTYGASLVHLNEEGQPIAPLYNYLKPLPHPVATKFYETYGPKEKLALETASPALGLLNAGLQLYWLKQNRPEIFKNLQTSLHLPQYLAFLVHGKQFSDITSIGCHTALWDFRNKNYHRWVVAEGLVNHLAPLLGCSQIIDTELEGKKLRCGTGLHDSSSAFIPYIKTVQEPFALLSTGTWCITLNAFNDHPLTPEELQQDCLCYLSFQGGPVKASRLFAGQEHEQETKKMAAHFQVATKYYTEIAYNPHWIKPEHPAEVETTWDCSKYDRYDEAYHHFIEYLVVKQKRSTDLVLHNSPVRKIFVDGGFARNTIYMNLLARAYPNMEVYAASVSQASALGAALAIHEHWNSREFPQSIVNVERY